MKPIPTAKELFDIMLSENDETTSTEMMIEFARLHVQEALKEGSEKAKIEGKWVTNEGNPKILGSYTRTFEGYQLNKESVLNAYPLDLIK